MGELRRVSDGVGEERGEVADALARGLLAARGRMGEDVDEVGEGGLFGGLVVSDGFPGARTGGHGVESRHETSRTRAPSSWWVDPITRGVQGAMWGEYKVVLEDAVLAAVDTRCTLSDESV